MNERTTLLKKVDAFAFAAFEWNLYLDTHPHDKDGIMMFHRMVEQANKYKEEFEAKFGPLTAQNSKSTDCWDWIEDPWPWDTY